MGTVLINERRSTAAINEALQHPVDIRTGNAAGEFSIAEATCSTFAEQIIVFVIVFTARIEFSNRRHAFFHRLTSFDNQRSVTLQSQKVARQQTGRTGADNDRAMRQRLISWNWMFEFRSFPLGHINSITVAKPINIRIRNRQTERVNILQSKPVPRIHALAQNLQSLKISQRNIQTVSNFTGQFVLGQFNRSSEICNSQEHTYINSERTLRLKA